MRKINLRFDRRQFAKSAITAVMGDEKSTVVCRRVVSRRFTQSFPQIYAERRVHKFIALKKQEYSTFCEICGKICVNLREITLRMGNHSNAHYFSFAVAATVGFCFCCSSSNGLITIVIVWLLSLS